MYSFFSFSMQYQIFCSYKYFFQVKQVLNIYILIKNYVRNTLQLTSVSVNGLYTYYFELLGKCMCLFSYKSNIYAQFNHVTKIKIIKHGKIFIFLQGK